MDPLTNGRAENGVQAASEGEARLEIAGMSKTFGSGTDAVHALRNVELTVDSGEFVTILGPSGCGKSTLLDCVAGYIAPTEGSVRVGGSRIESPDPDRGVVFQENRLFPWKTVAENVGFGPRMSGKDDVDIEALLDRMGLADFADSYPTELSGGMAQRAELARLLANRPSIMVMDEPFSALDAMTKERMQVELLDAWRNTGATALFVTHDVEEAIFLGDRVVVLSARPGEVKTTVDVPIERPRNYESRTTETFTEIKRQLLASIHGEANAEFVAERPA